VTKQDLPPTVAGNCDPLLDAADCAGPLLQTHPLGFQLPLSLKQKEARLCFLQACDILKALLRNKIGTGVIFDL